MANMALQSVDENGDEIPDAFYNNWDSDMILGCACKRDHYNGYYEYQKNKLFRIRVQMEILSHDGRPQNNRPDL